MKKAAALTTALLLASSLLTACGGGNNANNAQNNGQPADGGARAQSQQQGQGQGQGQGQQGGGQQGKAQGGQQGGGAKTQGQGGGKQQGGQQGGQQGQQNVMSEQDKQKGLYEDKKLEAAVKKVQNVKHATVMVAGTTAYVMVEDTGSMKKTDITGPNTDANILNAPEATNLPDAMTTRIRDTIIRTNPNLRRVVFLNP